MMAALMFLGTMCMTSCGDDDKDDIEDIIEDVESGNIKATTKFEEKGNQMILTATWKNMMTQVHTATFEDDACVSYIIKDTYASDKLADAAWEEIQKDEEDARNYTRNGKVITCDESEEYRGFPKEEMRMVLQWIAEELAQMGNFK